MESGLEQGSAFVVYYDGEPVLDMWAGYADIQSLRRWRNDTTTMLFGAGQAITAFLVALMVDRYLQLLKVISCASNSICYVYRCLSQPLFIFGVFTSITLIFVNAASTY
ncbi:hypothetical protein DPMN_178594 [Dreissena polymorpha]|uniref:Beta-lactamase-related domain-containing protein n=1 Tax=Dreissena polymorpha TaxID=45954 RepID=A0A9D4ILK3_DREPO|nr:hypothetical protein DPMN_178594 [Dreissena polymorpha]